MGIKKWHKSFNPSFRESNWKPANSSPDIGLHDDLRSEILVQSLQIVANVARGEFFDEVVILWPAGVSIKESVLEIFEKTKCEFIQHSGVNRPNDHLAPGQVDLDSWDCLEYLKERVQSGSRTLIISALVINTLMDARPLLRATRSLLRRSSGNVFASINATPKGSLGLCHSLVFEEEFFYESMIDAGFQPRSMSNRLRELTTPEDSFRINFFGCTDKEHFSFLTDVRVDPGTKVLNITTESAALEVTGGIGRYCEEFDKSQVSSLFLLALHDVSLVNTEKDKNLWVTLDDLVGSSPNGGLDYDGVLQATYQLMFVFDELEIIEYQDYLGIGYRVSQANKVGLLPSSMRLHCVAHGNQFYIQSGFDEFGRSDSPETPVFERIAAECADEVVFATNFLHRMYVDQLGWNLNSFKLRPYPNSFNESVSPSVTEPIRKIAFLGKDSFFKGFDIFLDAIRIIASAHKLSDLGIDSIVVLGTDLVPTQLDSLEDVELFVKRPNSQNLSEQIEELSGNAIFVLPYRGDNSPLLVQEVIQKGTRYLLGNAGGIPEMVPLEIAARHLVDLDSKTIANRILEEISLSRTNTKHNPPDLATFYNKQNADFEAYFNIDSLVEKKTDPEILTPISMGIIVTMYNPSLNEVLDCITGINNQISPANEVIFVDDCSSEESFADVKQLIESHLLIKNRIIRHNINRGLSASRNSALRQVKQETLIALDIDDVIHPRYILNLRKAFLLSGADIVTSGSKYFQEEYDFRRIHNLDHGTYLPKSESLALSLSGNTIGHACAGYKTAYLTRFSGWDESNRALWEDYQFFIRATIDGAKIAIIPEAMLFYRIRLNSMVRTYRTFPGYLRLMSELQFLPSNHRFEFLSSVIASQRPQSLPPSVTPPELPVPRMGIWIDMKRVMATYSSDYFFIRAARVVYRLLTLKFFTSVSLPLGLGRRIWGKTPRRS